jgi:hypothetical protein
MAWFWCWLPRTPAGGKALRRRAGTSILHSRTQTPPKRRREFDVSSGGASLDMLLSAHRTAAGRRVSSGCLPRTTPTEISTHAWKLRCELPRRRRCMLLLHFPPATKAHTVKAFVDDDFPPAEQWRSHPDGQFLCNPPIQVAVLFQLPREGLLRRLQGRRPQIRCGARVRNERHLVFSSEERLGACRPLADVGRAGSLPIGFAAETDI